jgi:hypothetical protein
MSIKPMDTNGGSTALTFRNFTCRRWVIGGVRHDNLKSNK